jgi:hypothetical protein
VKRLVAFQRSAQTGIYVDVHHHRAGAGRDLYTQLLWQLAGRGYRQVFAGITQPNEASNGFSSILRVHRRRLAPAGGMAARQLAQRGMDATRPA